MSPGLRNEDYVAFLDESGEEDIQVVAGVLIPARWLRSAERRWRDFVQDRLGSRSGRTEVKSRDLLMGSGISLHAQNRILAGGGSSLSAKAAGRQFFRDALEHIASVNEVRILAVGLWPTSWPVRLGMRSSAASRTLPGTGSTSTVMRDPWAVRWMCHVMLSDSFTCSRRVMDAGAAGRTRALRSGARASCRTR